MLLAQTRKGGGIGGQTMRNSRDVSLGLQTSPGRQVRV
jgi:hypothetical protein